MSNEKLELQVQFRRRCQRVVLQMEARILIATAQDPIAVHNIARRINTAVRSHRLKSDLALRRIMFNAGNGRYKVSQLIKCIRVAIADWQFI